MKEDNQEMTLEEGFAKLDDLTQRMEQRDTSLEDSFQIYQEGMKLLKLCSEKIDTVEKKMIQINADGEISDF